MSETNPTSRTNPVGTKNGRIVPVSILSRNTTIRSSTSYSAALKSSNGNYYRYQLSLRLQPKNKFSVYTLRVPKSNKITVLDDNDHFNLEKLTSMVKEVKAVDLNQRITWAEKNSTAGWFNFCMMPRMHINFKHQITFSTVNGHLIDHGYAKVNDVESILTSIVGNSDHHEFLRTQKCHTCLLYVSFIKFIYPLLNVDSGADINAVKEFDLAIEPYEYMFRLSLYHDVSLENKKTCQCKPPYYNDVMLIRTVVMVLFKKALGYAQTDNPDVLNVDDYMIETFDGRFALSVNDSSKACYLYSKIITAIFGSVKIPPISALSEISVIMRDRGEFYRTKVNDKIPKGKDVWISHIRLPDLYCADLNLEKCVTIKIGTKTIYTNDINNPIQTNQLQSSIKVVIDNHPENTYYNKLVCNLNNIPEVAASPFEFFTGKYCDNIIIRAKNGRRLSEKDLEVHVKSMLHGEWKDIAATKYILTALRDIPELADDNGYITLQMAIRCLEYVNISNKSSLIIPVERSVTTVHDDIDFNEIATQGNFETN